MYSDDKLTYYFVRTGFFDLLPCAKQLAEKNGFSTVEMIEAICKVADKAKDYPPTRNRTAWFTKVFLEKLHEARADILAAKTKAAYRTILSRLDAP